MAKCDICGKGVNFGINISHSHRRSNRAVKPNVKRVKDALMKKEIVTFNDKDEAQVIDPLFEYWFRRDVLKDNIVKEKF